MGVFCILRITQNKLPVESDGGLWHRSERKVIMIETQDISVSRPCTDCGSIDEQRLHINYPICWIECAACGRRTGEVNIRYYGKEAAVALWDGRAHDASMKNGGDI